MLKKESILTNLLIKQFIFFILFILSFEILKVWCRDRCFGFHYVRCFWGLTDDFFEGLTLLIPSLPEVFFNALLLALSPLLTDVVVVAVDSSFDWMFSVIDPFGYCGDDLLVDVLIPLWIVAFGFLFHLMTRMTVTMTAMTTTAITIMANISQISWLVGLFLHSILHQKPISTSLLMNTKLNQMINLNF